MSRRPCQIDGWEALAAFGCVLFAGLILALFHEAARSPTGTYWRCYWGGKRKCFFFPPPNT